MIKNKNIKKTKSKILVLGDLHLAATLSYSTYIDDGRKAEKQEILDFIVKSAEDCSSVIFLGDSLDCKTNPPQVIREFTNFIERFSGKNIYIIAGNHEVLANGTTAIDYLKEIKNPLWHIITKTPAKLQIGANSAVFLPYMTKAELEAKDNKEALKEIMKRLEPADMLFHHHTMGIDGKIAGLPLDIEMLPEPILPIEELTNRYKLIISGHIHSPKVVSPNVIVAGSIFSNSINEKQKYIWKIEPETLEVEQIKLPGRDIYGINDPTEEQIKEIPKNSIVKITLTKKRTVEKVETLKKELKRFDAFILLEKIPKIKKKMHYGNGEAIMNFNINELLELYSKEKKVNIELLNRGFNLIK